MRSSIHFRRLAGGTLLLTVVVVMLGAYVRLSDAGLGCPDWPGCYGQLLVPEATEHFPERPLDPAKAWKEMVHRYAAGTLGLLIVALAVVARRRRELSWARPHTGALVMLVIVQALLGMWTVTLKLLPLVVMGHLLGGLAIASLLFFVYLKSRAPVPSPFGRTDALTRIALLLVILQIGLGGWTSANYAAPVCPDFPTCQGSWWPPMNFADALRPTAPPAGGDYEGGTLDGQARTAIHVVHRFGAVLTLLVVGALAVRLLRREDARAWGMALGGALLLQFTIGVANVLMVFPLALAVAHNGGALLLLLAVVGVHQRVVRTEAAGSLAPRALAPE